MRKRKAKKEEEEKYIVHHFLKIYTLSPGGLNMDCNLNCSGSHKSGPVLLI